MKTNGDDNGGYHEDSDVDDNSNPLSFFIFCSVYGQGKQHLMSSNLAIGMSL